MLVGIDEAIHLTPTLTGRTDEVNMVFGDVVVVGVAGKSASPTHTTPLFDPPLVP